MGALECGRLLVLCLPAGQRSWHAPVVNMCSNACMADASYALVHQVYAYHGQARDGRPSFLASQDIVITTYSTLAQELNARGGLLKANAAQHLFAWSLQGCLQGPPPPCTEPAGFGVWCADNYCGRCMPHCTIACCPQPGYLWYGTASWGAFAGQLTLYGLR